MIIENILKLNNFFCSLGASRYAIHLSLLVRYGLFLALMNFSIAACAPQVTPPPPLIPPSAVTTENGMIFFVKDLRIPGTIQQIRTKAGSSSLWIPLAQIERIQFTGPVDNRYRPARIFLISGDRFDTEVFVDHLLEGATDLGYWNMPLMNINSIVMAAD
jgi:hypothetical protein